MNAITIERCNKNTDEVIAVESAAFFQQPLNYVKSNIDEFIYVYSPTYEDYKMDAVVFEFDEMFDLYTALFGLQMKKMYSKQIKEYLRANLKDVFGASSASFSGDEGIWEINIALNAIEGFTGDETVEEANAILLNFVETMLAAIAE